MTQDDQEQDPHQIMSAEHPGEISMEEALNATERARTWYNEAIPYVARLYVEAAQEHAAVREALLKDEGEPLIAVHTHDPDRAAEINALGVSAFQGLSAEQLAAEYLKNDSTA